MYIAQNTTSKTIEQANQVTSQGPAANPANPVIKVKIVDLKQHPSQHSIFAMDEERIEALAADMKRRGLQHPIEILPDKTIICGHCRVEAAKKLGWEEIEAVVREDLAKDGAAVTELWLIDDNLKRRQLDPLEKARCIQRKIEVIKEMPWGKRPEEMRGDLRDVVARGLGISGRTLSRLMQLLKLPMAIQNAVSRKQLPESKARAVERLSKEVQDQIATEIEAGGEPEDVIAHYITPKQKKHKKAQDAKKAFFKSIEFALTDLEGRTAEIKKVSPEEARLLQRMEEMIRQIQKDAVVWTPEQARAALAEKLQRFKGLGRKKDVARELRPKGTL